MGTFLYLFNFHLSYRPGSKNTKPDALPRIHCPDPAPEEPELILRRSCILGAVQWEVKEQVKSAVNQIPIPEDCPPNRLFIFPELRSAMIHWSHSLVLSCHTGVKQTLYRSKQRFWWPSMSQDFAEYIAACPTCASCKPSNTASAGLLNSFLPIRLCLQTFFV